MSIAYQPAMTAEPVRTRPISTHPEPGRAGSPHTFVLVEEPARAWTIVKIVGLVALTALSAALATAIVLGGALFAVLNLH